VFLAEVLGWPHAQVGGFMALWIIGYGGVQALAPAITGLRRGPVPDGRAAFGWALPLAALAAGMAAALWAGWPAQTVLVTGLLAFGVLFALNSALHSYLIVSYAREDGVSLDVGFYYMANAGGRLLGTVLSGAVYQAWGLAACLAISAAFVLVAALVSLALPRHDRAAPTPVN
jgi:predicted MFS family arabinose efflux permease